MLPYNIWTTPCNILTIPWKIPTTDSDEMHCCQLNLECSDVRLLGTYYSNEDYLVHLRTDLSAGRVDHLGSTPAVVSVTLKTAQRTQALQVYRLSLWIHVNFRPVLCHICHRAKNLPATPLRMRHMLLRTRSSKTRKLSYPRQ